MASIEEYTNEYRMVCDTLSTLRIMSALMPLESGKRGRAIEIVNRLEDICTEHLKDHMEFLDLAEELRRILNEH